YSNSGGRAVATRSHRRQRDNRPPPVATQTWSAQEDDVSAMGLNTVRATGAPLQREQQTDVHPNQRSQRLESMTEIGQLRDEEAGETGDDRRCDRSSDSVRHARKAPYTVN